MNNKNVGLLIMGIGLVVGIIVFIFNYSMRSIVGATCSHGPSCTMYDTINFQLWSSIALVAIILIVGAVVYFSKPKEKLVIRTKAAVKHKIDFSGLDKDEKAVVGLIQKENGAMFQSTLMEKLEIGKVKATRLLDKLEAKQIIERKRRGMNNIVVLK